jgi:acetoin utilization protein AcuB
VEGVEMIKVSELMNQNLIKVTPDDTVESAVQLLQRRGVRHLLVMKGDRLAGIVSDRDIKRALDPQKTKKKLMAVGGLYFLLKPIFVKEIMTSNPVTIEPDTPAYQAAWIMVNKRFGALPVVRGGRTVGIVTETDLLRYFASSGFERESQAEEKPTRRPRRKD